jgi:hypothetical protein
MTKIDSCCVKGRVTLWQIDEKTGLRTPIVRKSNQIQYSWGFIAAKQLGYRRTTDRPDYHISAMYIEYENQADPEVPVSVGAFDRDLGISHYDALALSSDRDFLRIPLRLEPTLSIAAGFEEYFIDGENGNQLTFFAQTAGNTGINGKPFSANDNSKVFSAALVATPVFGDRTRDVIFARTYFDIADQTTKAPSSQIGITWDIAFE